MDEPVTCPPPGEPVTCPPPGEPIGVENEEDEYKAIGISLSWAGGSYLVLAALVVVNLFRLVHFWYAAAATVPGLLLGFLLALIGLKWDRKRAPARFAAIVTGSLLALIIVPLGVFAFVRFALR